MLDPDATRDYGDLTGDLARLRLGRPALDALASADGPVRQGELAVILVAERGAAVHSRTLSNALQFLADADLIIRRERSARNVVYEITSFGRDLKAALDAADRVAREHERKTNTDPGSPEEPDEPG